MIANADAATPPARTTIPLFAFAWTAVLAGSFLNFVNFHEYPLLSSEVGLVLAGIVVVGAIMGIAHGRAGAARGIFEAALVYLAVDLPFDTEYAAIPAVIAAVLYVAFRLSTVKVIAVIFAVVVAGQLVSTLVRADSADPAQPGTAGDPDLPAIVHVILDEHIGIEGLRAVNPRNEALASRLQAFYTERGFAAYGGAYSRHPNTTTSIPEILNFGATKITRDSVVDQPYVFEGNRYFESLHSAGYRINVRQSSFVDYCQAPSVQNCATYRFDDLNPIRTLSLSAQDRAHYLATAFISLSGGLAILTKFYDVALSKVAGKAASPPFINTFMPHLTVPLVSLASTDAFIHDLRLAQPGNVYFAHFLFPHFPYATRPDCTIAPLGEWTSPRTGSNTARQHRAYDDQVLCATRNVDRMLNALARSPAARNNIVIVHGDHGSRIVETEATVENADSIADSDMAALYSTLFAVRLTTAQGNYDPTPVPVSELLRLLSSSRMQSKPSPDTFGTSNRQVYIPDQEWRPAKLKSIPDFRGHPPLKKN